MGLASLSADGPSGVGARSTRWALRVTFFALFVSVISCKNRGHAALANGGAIDGGAEDGRASSALAPPAPPADDAVPENPGKELATRARHLLEAIAQDDPVLATDIEFPRDGWLATRDASDPGRDWEKRVAGPFRRAVHRASRRHRGLDRAEFVSIQIGHSMTTVVPKKHGWQKPLWTVRDSRVTFVVAGRTRTMTIREMTAWRGAFYITRL